MADSSSNTSRKIAEELLLVVKATKRGTRPGQTAGKELEEAIHQHLRGALPNAITGRAVTVSRKTKISDFAQYTHLATLQKLIDQDPTTTLRASIGTDYQIKPDVTVGLAPSVQGSPMFLHAAVPCKWTLRSDRAQNVRHEAVIMIRHRRGRLPHITPVTAEPMPTRLASLARGTSEVDAVYHIALDELQQACDSVGTKKQVEVLDELVKHGRVRDLSELAETLML